MPPPRALSLATLVAAAVLAGCAAVPDGPPPAPPEDAFRGVRTVALVHRLASSEPAEARRRDPLDALQDALSARGVETVAIDLPGRPPPDLAGVEEAARQAEYVAMGVKPEGGPAVVGSIGGRAAPALALLGADAFAVYVRGPAWGAPSQPLPLLGQPRSMGPSGLTGPVSAIALVAGSGAVVAVSWGGGSEPWGAGPVNAAEAVEVLVPLLLGAPQE